MGNEVLAVALAVGAALLYFIFRLDKRLAVIETELKFIKQHIGLDAR